MDPDNFARIEGTSAWSNSPLYSQNHTEAGCVGPTRLSY